MEIIVNPQFTINIYTVSLLHSGVFLLEYFQIILPVLSSHMYVNFPKDIKSSAHTGTVNFYVHYTHTVTCLYVGQFSLLLLEVFRSPTEYPAVIHSP